MAKPEEKDKNGKETTPSPRPGLSGGTGSGGGGTSSNTGSSTGPELNVFPQTIEEGGRVTIIVKNPPINDFEIHIEGQRVELENVPGRDHEFYWYTTNKTPGSYRVEVGAYGDGGFNPWDEQAVTVYSKRTDTSVTMQRTSATKDSREAFWKAIRNHTEAIGFNHYNKFIDKIIDKLTEDKKYYNHDSYKVLKFATKIFLLFPSDLVSDNDRNNVINEINAYIGDGRLPYLNHFEDIFESTPDQPSYFKELRDHRLGKHSMFELIWSYWHEEGMLVQTMNAIAMRFQNRRASNRDPLAQLEIDPLRPLNNLLWGFIQDELNRLTIPRRVYEYDHHYGITLVGKAVPTLRSADSRSKFIEAFHNLLYRAAMFYREDADTTVQADAFPLRNALREVHLILAEGTHNQFGDLPWVAREEMLIIQWLLARPEMKDFLRGRLMVPYHEPWMGTVDTMKKLQGWTDTGITHFHELAITGERIILSLRYDDWTDPDLSEDTAKAWARDWRSTIQNYIHAYNTATGVDLATEPRDSREAGHRNLIPSLHLQRRLASQAGGLRQLPAMRYPSRRPRGELEYHYGRSTAMAGNLLGMHEFD